MRGRAKVIVQNNYYASKIFNDQPDQYTPQTRSCRSVFESTQTANEDTDVVCFGIWNASGFSFSSVLSSLSTSIGEPLLSRVFLVGDNQVLFFFCFVLGWYYVDWYDYYMQKVSFRLCSLNILFFLIAYNGIFTNQNNVRFVGSLATLLESNIQMKENIPRCIKVIQYDNNVVLFQLRTLIFIIFTIYGISFHSNSTTGVKKSIKFTFGHIYHLIVQLSMVQHLTTHLIVNSQCIANTPLSYRLIFVKLVNT